MEGEYLRAVESTLGEYKIGFECDIVVSNARHSTPFCSLLLPYSMEAL